MGRVKRIYGKGEAFSRPRLIMPEVKPRKKKSLPKRVFAVAACLMVALIVIWGIYLVPHSVSLMLVPSSFAQHPIYPGAAILEAKQSTDCSNEPTYETIITSNDTNDAIKAFYKDKLNTEGWDGPKDLYGGHLYTWPSRTLDGNGRAAYELSIWFTGYSRKQISINSGFDRLCIDLTPVTTPTPTPPTINISHQEYDAALAKWRASGIEEYEISNVSASWGATLTTVRVNSRTGSILVKRSNADNFEEVSPQELGAFQPDTVEGMFEQVHDFLTAPTSEDREETMEGWHDGYEITLDPDLGYPVRIVGFPITDPGVIVTDANWSRVVTEMRIISRR